MSKHKDRRSFLKKLALGVGGISASALPSDAVSQESQSPTQSVKAKPSVKRGYNKPYEGEYLNRLAFPIGGIGAGMFCMEGTGAISHMSVRNKPDVFNEPVLFGALAVKGRKTIAKILEGPVPDWKMFGKPGTGNGAFGATYGLPRFNQAKFTASFPFGVVDLKDEEVPLEVSVKGWSPFTPGDADHSSLPAGALEYVFTNRGKLPVEAVFSYHAKNFLASDAEQGKINQCPRDLCCGRTEPKKCPIRREILRSIRMKMKSRQIIVGLGAAGLTRLP